MPIDTVGQMELELAQDEAKGIREDARQFSAIGDTIGKAVEPGVSALENVAKLEDNKRKQDEWNKLLSSGREGATQYANELGLDSSKYERLFDLAKNPKEIIGFYDLMKKESDKNNLDAESAKFGELIKSAGEGGEIGLDQKNTLLQELATASPEVQKHQRPIIQALQQPRVGKDAKKVSESKKAKDATDLLAKKLKITMDEAKFFDSRVNDSKIIKRAVNGVNIAVNRAVETARKGGDPTFEVMDQVLGVNLQKVLDPPSVVRESEFNRLNMTQGFLDMIKGKYDSLSKGGVGLTNANRARVVEFVNDMNKLSENVMRKNMLTMAVRSDFGKRFDPQEIDSDLFNPEEIERLKKVHSGEIVDEDQELIDRINANIEAFTENPDILGTEKGSIAGEEALATPKELDGTVENIKTMTLEQKKARLAVLKAKQGI